MKPISVSSAPALRSTESVCTQHPYEVNSSNFGKGVSSPTGHGSPSLICEKNSSFVFMGLNHELYGRKILHIESFSAKQSENLVRIAKFFV